MQRFPTLRDRGRLCAQARPGWALLIACRLPCGKTRRVTHSDCTDVLVDCEQARLHAPRATIAACMSIDVMRRRDDVALVLFDRMSREKNLSYPLTNAIHTMYVDTLYGVSACGCHHRGNGPDASQRPISHIGCGTGHRSRLTKRS